MLTQPAPNPGRFTRLSKGNIVSAFAGLAVGLSAVFLGGLFAGSEEPAASSVAAAGSQAAPPAVAADQPTAEPASPRVANPRVLTARSLERPVSSGVVPLTNDEVAWIAAAEAGFEPLWMAEALKGGRRAEFARLTARSQARTVRADDTPLSTADAQFAAEQEWWAAEL